MLRVLNCPIRQLVVDYSQFGFRRPHDDSEVRRPVAVEIASRKAILRKLGNHQFTKNAPHRHINLALRSGSRKHLWHSGQKGVCAVLCNWFLELNSLLIRTSAQNERSAEKPEQMLFHEFTSLPEQASAGNVCTRLLAGAFSIREN
jgi:hypothetical protein